MASPVLVVAADKDALGLAVVQRVTAIAKDAINSRGLFTVAVSGGSMPKILSRLAAEEGMEWDKWRLFFADERCVPLTDGDSNYRAWADAFLSSSGIPSENVFAIDPSLAPEAAARDYLAKLAGVFSSGEIPGGKGGGGAGAPPPPSFDAILLGMGPDGHTCSLFPGHALLAEAGVWVAHIEDSPKPPPHRITLTYPVLNNARNVLFVANGESKAALLPQFLRADPGGAGLVLVDASPYPAARVQPTAPGGTLAWCVDAAAAAQCPAEVLERALKS